MKLNKLILVSIVLLTLISLGAASAASDNVTADNLQIEMEEPDSIELSVPLDDEITADGDDIAVSNDGNSKLSAASDETVLSEVESQNVPKNYSNLTLDELTVEENNTSVFNSTIGTLTVNGNNVTIFNSTITSKLIFNGNEGVVHDNTVNVDVIVNGANCVVYGNTIGGTLTLKGNNAVAYDNVISDTVTGSINGASAGAEVYNNAVREISLTGNNVIVHDNIIKTYNLAGNSFVLSGNNCIVYGNDVQGQMFLTGNNVTVYRNTLRNKLIIGETESTISSTIYDNTMYNIVEIYGNQSLVYNNTINDAQEIGLTIRAENIEVYNNDIVNGRITTYSNNIWAHDNNVNGRLFIYNAKDNVNIYNNTFNGMSYGAHSSSRIQNSQNVVIQDNIFNSGILIINSNDITLENNTITNLNDYEFAISLGGATDCKIVGNKLYSASGNGNDAVEDEDEEESNIIEGNYPLKNTIIISANNITLGNSIRVTVSIENYPNQEYIQVICNGKIYNTQILFGKGFAYIYDLPAGEYAILAISEAFGVYDKGMNTTIVKVSKLNPTLDINITEPVIGQDVNVSVNITDATGNITFIVDGVENTVELTNVVIHESIYDEDEEEYIDVVSNYGVANYTISNVGAGNHSIVVVYKGDAKNEATYNSITFALEKVTSEIDLTYDTPVIGEDLVLNVNVANAIGIVKFVIDGVEANVTLTDGSATYTMEKVAAGTHSIVAEYLGDDANNPASASKSFTLEKSTPVVDIAMDDLKLGGDATVTVTVANATGKVNIIVDGAENIIDLTDSVATYTIQKVTAGTHTVVANYAGDDKNNPASASTSKALTVLATEITAVNVDGGLNINAALIDANGKGIENATILYKIGTQNATLTTGANGTFTIKGEENAKVEIYFAGTDTLFPTSTVISLSDVAPTRIASTINATQLTCYAVDTAAGEKGAMFKIVLSDASGNTLSNASVQFALNGKIYNRTTDENGTASVQVNINKANTYTCAISYLGDIKHEAAFTAVKVVVNKKKTTLTAKAKTYKVKAKTKKYTATLKTIKGSSADGKTYLKAGKKVTLKVNGKTYTAKTTKTGKVTFKITKLTKKGKFTAVIKFAGDNTYKAVTKKVKITVK